MSRLVIPKIECVESKDNFGRFVAQPLEKGFGITLGNALRRVMLNYLPGAAVTGVMIEGIQHEFSTIPHLKEDVPELLLNIKDLRLVPVSGQEGKLVLDVAGEGRVSAADIKPSTDFEISNPELYLATLDSPEAKLYIELDVEVGEGYREAESSGSLSVGMIAVDAIFTPIRKVNFSVESIHAGQEGSHQQLFLEVWTDGTVSPPEAISRSAEILVGQLSPFVEYVKVSQMKDEEEAIRLSIPEEQYNMSVEQLNLSVRTMNCLRRGGIDTVGQLIGKEEKELLSLHNFGNKSMVELEERLQAMELSLKTADEESAPAAEEPAGEDKEEETENEA